MYTMKRHSRRRRPRRDRPAQTVRYYRPSQDPLGLEIQAPMRADQDASARLRWCEPDPDGCEFDGYCAVAATAYFFLKGEELAGLDALAPAETVQWEAAGRVAYDAGYRAFCSYGGGHWWLEQHRDGEPSQVIDLNIGVEDSNNSFRYAEEGHGQKFQGPGYAAPSTRALELIRLVKATRRERASL